MTNKKIDEWVEKKLIRIMSPMIFPEDVIGGEKKKTAWRFSKALKSAIELGRELENEECAKVTDKLTATGSYSADVLGKVTGAIRERRRK